MRRGVVDKHVEAAMLSDEIDGGSDEAALVTSRLTAHARSIERGGCRFRLRATVS